MFCLVENNETILSGFSQRVLILFQDYHIKMNEGDTKEVYKLI